MKETQGGRRNVYNDGQVVEEGDCSRIFPKSIQGDVTVYKQVGRSTHDSQKREEALEKVTNVFMEQYTLHTDTN